MPTISATILATVSAILAYLASYLRDDALPEHTNLLIGIVATLILGVITAWVTGFTGNITQNILLVLTCWILFLHQMVTLLQQAHGAPSPLVISPSTPVIAPSSMPVGASTPTLPDLSALATSLIHITANSVHIPTTAPIASTPVIESTPEVATGITTPGEANEKTLKIAAVKVVQDATGEK